ncbi:hypothetical protein [Streptomyces decoyicus]|uniref:recombination directionality factor n=1 Tax=Streptomyces decoyicus TaxID=249567 RepID=UPI00398D1054
MAVGTFRSEEERCGGSSVALSSWLVTTTNEEVAVTVSGLYGGRPRRRDRQQEAIELMLDRDAIAVNIDGPGSVINRMVLEQEEGRGPIHVCDGSNLLEPMGNAGDPCGCPESLFGRKAAARSGHGPKPDSRLAFRLAAAPGVGMFVLVSSSWAFFDSLSAAVLDMERGASGARMEIRLQRKVVTTRSGMAVSYVHPILSVAEPDFVAPGHLQLVA